MRFLLALTAAALAIAAPGPAARADCYEDIGCTNSDRYTQKGLSRLPCETLWYVRNRIYQENGYCFKTSRAIRALGNAGCQFDDINAISLSSAERHNVAAIKTAERRKRCPK